MCDAKYCDEGYGADCDIVIDTNFCRSQGLTNTIYGGGDPSMEWDWWIYEGGRYEKARCSCVSDGKQYAACYGLMVGGK